ncbi:MAG: phage head closure protein [Alphaproteobacteria bacterium]|nr:phage head closure protein [Alphaproteobacteria bacterium]
MRIGSLQKRLTLQSESLVPDGAGGNAASWVTLATIWAELIPDTGGQAVASNFDRRITHTIRMRNPQSVAVKTGMRLVGGSRIFTIRAVVNDGERNRWLEIHAEEDGLLG